MINIIMVIMISEVVWALSSLLVLHNYITNMYCIVLVLFKRRELVMVCMVGSMLVGWLILVKVGVSVRSWNVDWVSLVVFWVSLIRMRLWMMLVKVRVCRTLLHNNRMCYILELKHLLLLFLRLVKVYLKIFQLINDLHLTTLMS